MPSFARRSRAPSPKLSFPYAPRKVTSPPARAAATAWLAPLPPPKVLNSPPRTVSPGFGRRSQKTTRSVLDEPATSTRGLEDPVVEDMDSHKETVYQIFSSK